ncbi:MAG TPA: hypothetical protein VEJ84_14915 [Acidimicrobiales bacterium]|nr:hypothetical protein [Acidimicrobiales bacterium]
MTHLENMATPSVAETAEAALLDTTRHALERLELAKSAPGALRYGLYIQAEDSLRTAAQLCSAIRKAMHRPAPKRPLKVAEQRATPAVARELGNDLHRAHRAAGLSDDQAAKTLGVTLAVLAAIETDGRPRGSLVEAAEHCPWITPVLLGRLSAAAEYVSQAAPIGADVGNSLLAARERAELTDREAAKSAGMPCKDYLTFEAGTRPVHVRTAERVRALPWVSPEVGAAIVTTVQADIDRRATDRLRRMGRVQ